MANKNKRRIKKKPPVVDNDDDEKEEEMLALGIKRKENENVSAQKMNL